MTKSLLNNLGPTGVSDGGGDGLVFDVADPSLEAGREVLKALEPSLGQTYSDELREKRPDHPHHAESTYD